MQIKMIIIVVGVIISNQNNNNNNNNNSNKILIIIIMGIVIIIMTNFKISRDGLTMVINLWQKAHLLERSPQGFPIQVLVPSLLCGPMTLIMFLYSVG